MEQGESITQTIPEDPGASRPGISTRKVLSFKSYRQRQRVQPSTRLLQTPRTAAPLSDQVFWQRGTAQGGLSCRRQWNREDLPNHGIAPRDAFGRLPEWGPRDPRDPEGV